LTQSRSTTKVGTARRVIREIGADWEDLDMGHRQVPSRRVGFRPPLTSVLPLAGIFAIWVLIVRPERALGLMMLFLVLITVVRLRQLLVLTDDHLEVTVLRTRRIPWVEVQGFDPGSAFLGGTRIQTTSGVVNSVSPCSWWGGPAREADLEVLRREARARART
jgi:hypothetical protein